MWLSKPITPGLEGRSHAKKSPASSGLFELSASTSHEVRTPSVIMSSSVTSFFSSIFSTVYADAEEPAEKSNTSESKSAEEPEAEEAPAEEAAEEEEEEPEDVRLILCIPAQ
jgi:hypothetical protein